jgi:hypothetical protein
MRTMGGFERMETTKPFGIYYAEKKDSPWLTEWYETKEAMDEAAENIMRTGTMTITIGKGATKLIGVLMFSLVYNDGTFFKYRSNLGREARESSVVSSIVHRGDIGTEPEIQVRNA